MVLLEGVAAYMAVESLMEQECPYKTAHALILIKKKLRPHVEFFAQEEKKLVELYGQRDEKGNICLEGRSFRFRSDVDPREYERKRAELCDVEIEEVFEKVHAPTPAVISPAHLEALEKFIIFEERTI